MKKRGESIAAPGKNEFARGSECQSASLAVLARGSEIKKTKRGAGLQTTQKNYLELSNFSGGIKKKSSVI